MLTRDFAASVGLNAGDLVTEALWELAEPLWLLGRCTEALDVHRQAVREAADESFNAILELGFASSIRKEWEWRISRGEPVRNLEAFRGPLGLDELGSPEGE